MLQPAWDLQQELAPEQSLAAAVLLQALRDLGSATPHVQYEARRFLDDPRAVHFWVQASGIEPEVFEVNLRRYLRDTQRQRAKRPRQGFASSGGGR